jgi:hypothetical protein
VPFGLSNIILQEYKIFFEIFFYVNLGFLAKYVYDPQEVAQLAGIMPNEAEVTSSNPLPPF